MMSGFGATVSSRVVSALGRQWYVDSVAGDDGNDGATADAAFATIAALSDIQAGDTINLVRGSHWREQLDIVVDRVTVRATGTGDAPILDASDPISGWSKTGGRTNVYQFSATPAWTVGKAEFAVWEDGSFLVRVADAAACDATAGSHAISGTSGTITVYVHASTSDDPETNGKTYEHTQRNYGLNARAGNYATIAGIETRNNLHSDGSTRAGKHARLTDCVFRNGNAHNVLVESGTLTSCTIIDAYVSHDNGVMLVFNQNTPAGETCAVEGCAFNNTVAFGSQIQAIYSHYNVSGAFGAITVEDSTFSDNITLAISASHMASLTVQRCTFNLVQGKGAQAIRANFAGATYTLCDNTHTAMDGRFLSIETNGLTLTIDGNEIEVGNTGSAAIYTTTTGCTITLTGNTFTPAAGITGNRVSVWASGAATTLNASGNLFTVGAYHYAYLCPNGINTMNSDYNTFSVNVRNRWTGSVNYAGMAAWQAASSQDAHSTEI